MLSEFLILAVVIRPAAPPLPVAPAEPVAVAGPVVEEHRVTRLVVYPRLPYPDRPGHLLVMVPAPGLPDGEPIDLPDSARLSIDGKPARDTYLLVWFRGASDPRVQLDRRADRYMEVTAARFTDAARKPVSVPASGPGPAVFPDRVRAVVAPTGFMSAPRARPVVYAAPRPVYRAAPVYAAPVCVGGSCAVPVQPRGIFGRR